MKYFTGIDVSLRSVSICVVDEAGAVLFETKVAAEVDLIVDCLRRCSVEIKQVGFEAGTLTQYLTYGLQAAGFEMICLEARQVAATLAAMRNKTDRNDARGLAQILRSGWYRRVHVKSLESHQVRALLSSRKTILSKCVDLENELRGLLKIFGVRLAPRVGHGSFDQALRTTITADPLLARALVPLLDARTVLYKTYLKLDNSVKAIVRSCQRLMTVPGVGPVTSLTFKVGVDDPGRFRSSRTVAAHFGLTPRRYQSGETDNPGRMARIYVTRRPVYIWIVLALLGAFTLWLFYAIVATAVYFATGGYALRLMYAYIPPLVGACICAVAWIALFQRRRWVRWLFLLPVVAATLQLLVFAPYFLLALKPIADPAARASVFHIVSGVVQPVIFLLVALAIAISVFRYFRAAKTLPAIKGANER